MILTRIMQHVPITYSPWHALFDDQSLFVESIPGMLAVLVTDTGSNQRQTRGRASGTETETERERVESNKQSDCRVYSSCIRGSRRGPASPFSSAGFSLDRLAFTPYSQLSHLKPLPTPTNPPLFFSPPPFYSLLFLFSFLFLL